MRTKLIIKLLLFAACTAIAVAHVAHADDAPSDSENLNYFAISTLNPLPAPNGPVAIGNYGHGCLLGGQAIQSPGLWELMHPSRHRYFGHPDMQSFLQYLADKNGRLAVGDIAQPAGGPTPSDHVAHTNGLDVDIRYEILPKKKKYSQDDLEKHEAVVVAVNQPRESKGQYHLESHMISGMWNDTLSKLLKTAAEYPRTDRIFVSPPIKKEMCAIFGKSGNYPSWLLKIRPWFEHDDHFHVRLKCPDNSPACEKQAPPPVQAGDATKVGCAGKDIDWWTSQKTKDSYLADWIKESQHPEPPSLSPKWLKAMDKLPDACKQVLNKIIAQTKATAARTTAAE